MAEEEGGLNADDRPIGPVGVDDSIVRSVGPRCRPLTRAPITSMSELLQALC